MNRLALLGSTGSVGTSCLDVVARHRDRLSVHALVAHRRCDELAAQCHRFRPAVAVIADASLSDQVDRTKFPAETALLFGEEAVAQVAAAPEVTTVVSAIVGAAGLKGTWAAAEAGKRIALANKETLVVAGPQILKLVRESGGVLLPVDSEHSAIFQALQSGQTAEVERIVLTASGGPFRQKSLEELARVTVKEALAHPTWNMGPKITIDSATMMNKSLEVIEARWLFGLEADRIAVVVHPQSLVHSMVEFCDGSVIAQMSPPDMKLPIQYALTYPDRWPSPAAKMNWSQPWKCEFFPPDFERFPALDLGFRVARDGGTSGAVLNACNEVAVARFLDGHIAFTQISRACREILLSHTFDEHPTLNELFRQDSWAREEMRRWIA